MSGVWTSRLSCLSRDDKITPREKVWYKMELSMGCWKAKSRMLHSANCNLLLLLSKIKVLLRAIILYRLRIRGLVILIDSLREAPAASQHWPELENSSDAYDIYLGFTLYCTTLKISNLFFYQFRFEHYTCREKLELVLT